MGVNKTILFTFIRHQMQHLSNTYYHRDLLFGLVCCTHHSHVG